MNKWTAGLAALMACCATPLIAADLDLNTAPELKLTTPTKKWYIKGYIGVNSPDISGFHRKGTRLLTGPLVADMPDHSRGKLGDGFMVGAGLGYRIHDLFRVDMTLDYRAQKSLDARDWFGLQKRGYKGRVSSYVMMTNGYFDLGTFRSFTPYIGAGIGAANNRMEDVSIPTRYGLYHASSQNNWEFVWALHAGVGIELSPSTTLDVGYSYSDLGDTQSGRTYDGTRVRMKGLRSHDIKVGLRYAFH